jgi:hypothetical protein
MANSIRGKIADISKGKRIHATIVEMINGRVTASTNGRLYKGLDVIGGPVVVGQKVWLDFSSGTPIVHAYSSSSGNNKTTSVRSIVTRIISDNEIVDPDTSLEPGNHSHTQSQIIDLDYDAQKIRGVPVDAVTDQDHKKFLMYDFENNRFIVTKIKVEHIDSETSSISQVITSNGNKVAFWSDQSGSGGGGTSAPDVLMNQIFS